jgi:hypothetical protein
MAPNEHDPYSERWNFGFQQSLTSSTLLEVLYAGNHAVHLPIASHNINANTSRQIRSGTRILRLQQRLQ